MQKKWNPFKNVPWNNNLGKQKAGIAFLENNKKQAGVQTTASGLQYQVITEGKGEKPLPTDKVKVNYHGTLIDGTVLIVL